MPLLARTRWAMQGPLLPAPRLHLALLLLLLLLRLPPGAAALAAGQQGALRLPRLQLLRLRWQRLPQLAS